MADFIIKPTSGNLILKDDQNVARMTIAPTTGATTFSGATTLANATITAGTISASALPSGITELVATITASGQTTLDFNSTYVTAAHDSYELHIIGAVTSANWDEIEIWFSYNNGTNFYTVSWGSYHKAHDGTNFVQLGYHGTDTSWSLGQGGGTPPNVGGILRMTNMNAVGSEFSHGDSLITYPHSATSTTLYGAYSSYTCDQSLGRTNFIRIGSKAGATFDSGMFKLYGRVA